LQAGINVNMFISLVRCNRTFVENRKYVEVLAAVGTLWQGDFWRQEGLTESKKGGSKKVGRRP